MASNAFASGFPLPISWAPSLPATNSREREMANWINIAASGPKIANIAARLPDRLSSSSVKPPYKPILYTKATVLAITAAIEAIKISRLLI